MVANRFYGPICQVRDWFVSDLRSSHFPCWFETAILPPRVVAPASAYDRLRSNGGSASLSSATTIANYHWPYGSDTSAESFVATLSGHRIEITRPAVSVTTLPSVQQVCDALKAVPVGQRHCTRKVILCPQAHPNSTSRRIVGGEAGSGEITLFPLSTTITQNDVDNRIMHEIGHNYQESLWHSSSAVAQWTAVAARDSRSPSIYAQSNSGDDFCEFLIIFNAARGTPCEASARSLFHHRWEKMLTY